MVEFFEGKLGQPVGGFPKELQKRVLKGRKPIKGRPGATIPPADFDATREKLTKTLGRRASDRDVVTHLLYPRVAADFHAHQVRYSDTSVLPTNVFFFGMDPGEEISVDIEEGKTLIIKFLTVSDPHRDGRRLVFFELNGQPREVLVVDNALDQRRPHPSQGRAGQSPPSRRPDARPGRPRQCRPRRESAARGTSSPPWKR